jgi:hypothetical protein
VAGEGEGAVAGEGTPASEPQVVQPGAGRSPEDEVREKLAQEALITRHMAARNPVIKQMLEAEFGKMQASANPQATGRLEVKLQAQRLIEQGKHLEAQELLADQRIRELEVKLGEERREADARQALAQEQRQFFAKVGQVPQPILAKMRELYEQKYNMPYEHAYKLAKALLAEEQPRQTAANPPGRPAGNTGKAPVSQPRHLRQNELPADEAAYLDNEIRQRRLGG